MIQLILTCVQGRYYRALKLDTGGVTIVRESHATTTEPLSLGDCGPGSC